MKKILSIIVAVVIVFSTVECVIYAEDNEIIVYLDGKKIEFDVKPKIINDRTMESEVSAYLNKGWCRTIQETQQTLYAADGRTITVFKLEVSSYKKLGWYETQSEAQAADHNINIDNSSSSNNNSAEGYYYRTPYGKRYHLDPDGGKNSYRTTDITGLSPCAKCVK